MINKILSVLMFAVWFKVFNVFFYSFLDIPSEMVTGEGINLYKVYWLFFFLVTSFIGYKVTVFTYHFNRKRARVSEFMR